MTQNLYDQTYGTLTRRIQTDTSGADSKYIVTVTNYGYQTDDFGEMSAFRDSGIHLLAHVEQYAPFEIDGSDSEGLRFTRQPDADTWIKRTILDASDNPDDAARGQILSMSERLTEEGKLHTTLYENYKLLNEYFEIARPQVTTDEIQFPDSLAATGYDDHVVSKKYTVYDNEGLLKDSVVAIAPDPDTIHHNGWYLVEGEAYQYTGTEAKGLLSEVERVSGTVDNTGFVNIEHSHPEAPEGIPTPFPARGRGGDSNSVL